MNAQPRRRPGRGSVALSPAASAAYRRRGVALLIVLALLGLFAAIGVSFAVLARSESRGAANFKRGVATSATQRGESIPPAELFKLAVNQLLSDTTNVQSALRGHSLLRDMFGGPDTGDPATGQGDGVGAEYRVVATAAWAAAQGSGHFGVVAGMPPGRLPYWGAYNGTGLFGPRKYADPSVALAAGDKLKNGVLNTAESILPYLMVTPPRDFGAISPEYWGDPFDLSAAGAGNASRIYPLLPYNYTRFPPRGAVSGTRFYGNGTVGLNEYPSPEKFRVKRGGATATHFFAADEDYDAADFNNMFLALERADGTIIQPSFHRPHLVRQLEHSGVFGAANATFPNPAYHPDPAIVGAANYDDDTQPLANLVLNGRRAVFRPRLRDYDANTVKNNGLPANFPAFADKNGNGIVGDDPAELDVDTDGDGKKDAIWVDAGLPAVKLPDGTWAKPLVAIKVLGLDGKINLNVAGNFLKMPSGASLGFTPANAATAARLTYDGRPEGHSSTSGSDPSLVNPLYALLLNERYDNAFAPGAAVPAGMPAMDAANADANHPAGAALRNWPIALELGPNFTASAANFDPQRFVDPLFPRWLDFGLPTAWATDNPALVDGRWTRPADRRTFSTMDLSNLLPPLQAPAQPVDPATNPYGQNRLDTAGGVTILRPQPSSSLGGVNVRGHGREYSPYSGRAHDLVKQALIAAGRTPAQAEDEANRRLTAVGVNQDFGEDFAVLDANPPPFGETDPNLPTLKPRYFTDMGPFAGALAAAAAWKYPQDFDATAPADPWKKSVWQARPAGIAADYAAAGAYDNMFKELRWGLQAPNALHRGTAHFGKGFLDANPFTVVPNVARPTEKPFDWSAFEALWRGQDLDASNLDPRLASLLKVVLADETSQAATSQYVDWKFPARQRARRLFTAGSWDLVRYGMPPTAGDVYAGAAPPANPATATQSGNSSFRNDQSAFGAPTAAGLATLGPAGGNYQHNGVWGFPNAGGGTEINQFGPLNTPWWVAAIAAAAPANGNATAYLTRRFPQEVLAGKRFDLARPLTSYESHPLLADAERTAMAEQLYLLLCYTAGLNTKPVPTSVAEAKEAVAHARTLAQLAVNIVDYIDADNVMTTMPFHPFPFSAAGNVATEWDAMEGLTNANATAPQPATYAPGLSLMLSRSEYTVMGFELPDLVIGEGVSVTQNAPTKSPNPMPSDPDEEVTMVFAELWNPWPAGADLDANGDPRGTLFDNTAAKAGQRTLPQARFLVGVRQELASGFDFHKGPSKFRLPTDYGQPDDHFVDFSTTQKKPNGTALPDGEFATPRGPLAAQVLRAGQRLFLEPERYYKNSMDAADPDDPQEWIGPQNGATPLWTDAGTGANRYTSGKGRIASDPAARRRSGDLRLRQPQGATVAPAGNVAITLYRVRNPYLAVNSDGNALTAGPVPNAAPNHYVAIDSLALRNSGAGQKYGAYLVTGSGPGATPAIDQRKSVERRQPWVGCATPWAPYQGLAGNLKPAALYDPPAAGNVLGRLLEGKFLGFPYLTANIQDPDPATATAASIVQKIAAPKPMDQDGAAARPPFDAPTFLWGNHLRENGFAEVVAAKNHTFFADAGDAVAATNLAATANSRDLVSDAAADKHRYLSFPVANRQLASPMELLSVRLYGSAMWKVPGSKGDLTTPPAGAQENLDEGEWRQRFTDDFEFTRGPDYALQSSTQVAGKAVYPPAPYGGGASREWGFARVFRSREVPWYLTDRRLHPMDPNNFGTSTTGGYADPAPINNEAYHPEPVAVGADTNVLKHNLAPFPDLHRFFEFVECARQTQESPTAASGPAGWARYQDLQTTPALPADNRKLRKPGGINLNLVVDEEVFKALVDGEEALPWTPMNAGGAFAYTGQNLSAVWANGSYFRPLRYPTEGADPVAVGGTSSALPTKALAWQPDATATGPGGNIPLAELTLSFSNDRLVMSNGAAGATPLLIDFGGALASATFATMFSMAPQNLYGLGVGNLGYLDATQNQPNAALLNLQFPGIVNWYTAIDNSKTLAAGLPYPGWQRDQQVSSELFRQFVLSRTGRDGVLGTMDDKPFTSFASAFLSDTLLRRRNYAYLDMPRDGRVAGTAAYFSGGTVGGGGTRVQVVGTNLPSANNGSASGEYINRLGGQWTPRLFDPVPSPYLLDNNPADPTVAASFAGANTKTLAGRGDVASNAGLDAEDVDYWMLEKRRNELLTKIANSITVRSHVFGVWMTLGYFRIEPGTETDPIPLLHEEIGSNTGEARRPRLFMVVDRSEAWGFEQPGGGLSPAQLNRYFILGETRDLNDHPLVKHLTIIE